jgi:predicted AAA+ superfamily ATPase
VLKRHLQTLIDESLAHFPVVLLIGARQVGKSTLAQKMIGPAWPARYLTLDDRTTLDAALADPDGFVHGLEGPVSEREREVFRRIGEVESEMRPARPVGH